VTEVAVRTRPEPRRRRAQVDDFPVVSPKNYAVGEEFARGGLGKISQALDKRLDRIIALKELHITQPAIEARFAREIQITARLQHPNIVPVHEAGRWPSGAPFFAMKLVEGHSLAQEIKLRRRLEKRLELLSTVIAVAEAMAYSHTEGVIHRDLKPHNVLLGPFGETVVIDWGLAKDLREVGEEEDATPPALPRSEGYATTDGAVMGTPAYMPPEQAFGDPVDERADVYSLGAILYHVLSGSPPYVREGIDDVIERVRQGPPTPLEVVEPDAPAELVAIVTKAMAYRMEDRYRTAQQMAEELRNYATGRLVSAYAYGPWDYLARWVHRNRAAFVTALLGVLLLAGVGVYSYRSILVERDRAEEALARTILETAREAVARDPTLAAARLKALAGPLVGAASVAASAEERGVARWVLAGHEDQVHAVAFSPDGKKLASGSHDYSVRLWDLETGESRIIAGHDKRVTAVLFSPDGAYVVSSGYDHRVRAVDVESLAVVDLAGHTRPVKALSFSHDGRLLAAVSDGAVTVWDGLTFEERLTARVAGDRHLVAAFTPGGEAVATASHDRAIRVWDVAGFDSIRLEGHERMVTSLAFSPDGELLASGSEDGTVRLWNRHTGQSRVVIEHGNEVTAVAFSPDGAWLASGGNDELIRVWSRGNGVRELAGHGGDITALRFGAGGTLISTSWDKTVRLWRVDTGDPVATLLGHRDVVSGLATRGELLATSSWDKEIRVWPISAAAHPRVLRGHRNGVHGVDVHGPWIASGARDDTVRVWNTETGESRELVGHTDHIFRVQFSPDGKWVASSSDDRSVRLWSTETWEGRVLRGHQADVEELTFSPNGRWLASASEDDTVRLWEVATGSEAQVLRGHLGYVTDVAFSADSRYLASSSKDATVRWWDLEAGTSLVFEGHDAEVDGVDVAAQEYLVASASEDGTVQLWRPLKGSSEVAGRLSLPWRVRFAPGGRRLGVAGLGANTWICEVGGECRHLSGHTGRVWDLEFTGDGRALVTGSADATVRIWDVATGESRELLGHLGSVFDVAVTRDGNTVASASADNTVRTWRLRLPPSPVLLSQWLDQLTNYRGGEVSR
jgi:WD40 repeat protein